jgi:hypothetical protein
VSKLVHRADPANTVGFDARATSWTQISIVYCGSPKVTYLKYPRSAKVLSGHELVQSSTQLRQFVWLDGVLCVPREAFQDAFIHDAPIAKMEFSSDVDPYHWMFDQLLHKVERILCIIRFCPDPAEDRSSDIVYITHSSHFPTPFEQVVLIYG